MMQIRFDSLPMVKGIRLAAVLWVLLFSATSFADETPESVVSIRIEGNETIPSSSILKKIETQPYRPLTGRMVLEDERSLRQTRWFSHVQSRFEDSAEGPVLVFRVRERAIVRSVTFVGNKKIKRKHLVSWTGLEKGSPFDHLANQQAVSRIEQEYKEKGHYHVRVTLKRGGDPDDRDVVIHIDEGPVVRVTRRDFRGSDEVGAGSLRKNLVTKSAILGLFKGIYRPESLEQDVAALEQYYRQIGYFDAQVDAEPLFSRDGSAVRVIYTVEEGTRYKVGRIHYEGNSLFEGDALRREARVNEGDFFSSNELTKDISDMLDPYWEKGHYYASIVPVPQFTEQAGVVDLLFQIDEDQPRFIRNINAEFTGDAPYTRETVLLDHIQVRPGDLADPRKIRRGQSRANGSQVFQSVQLNVVRVDEGSNLFTAGSRTYRGQGPLPGSGPHSTWLDELSESMDRLPELPRSGHSGISSRPTPSKSSDRRPRPEPERTAPISEAPERSDTSFRMTEPFGGSFISYRPITPAYFQRPWGQLLTTQLSPPQDDLVIRAQSPGGYYPGFGQGPGRGNPVLENGPYFPESQELPPGYIDINAIGTEGRTGRIMFGAGVNSDNGVVGSFVWEENNFDLFNPPRSFSDVINGRAFRGGGQRFRAEAAPGDIVSRYAVNWVDQYFMHTDYALSLSGFYYNRFFDDWDEDRVGGRVGIGRQLNPEQSVNLTLRMEEVTISSPTVPTPAQLANAVGSNFLSTVRATATNDTRDTTILPGEGHFLEAGFEQAFGDFTYSRFDGEGRHYFTLNQRPDGSGRQVLSLGGTLGFSTSDTPVFERYYAGGFQSFRGFAYRGVSPQVGGVAIGGTFQFLTTAEYRVPVTADDMIQVVAFADAGTVDNSVTFDRFRATVGVGLRVMIPAMGQVPLAFDFGFPVAKEAFDDERIFSFYVGILQ